MDDAGVDEGATELGATEDAGVDDGATEDTATELGATEDAGVDDAGVELLPPPPPQAVSPNAINDRQKARGTCFMVMVSSLWFIVVVNYTIR